MSEELDWEKLEEVFTKAIDLGEDDRGPYVANACNGNTMMFDEVQSLLEAHGIALERKWLQQGKMPRMLDYGDLIDTFVVKKQLGRGAGGEVYKVVHEATGQNFAIKCLPLIYNDDKEVLQRFTQEAELNKKLIHPNINRMYGLFQSDHGLYYLLMDYCEGETLAALMNRFSFNQAQAVKVIDQVCKALSAAHAQRIWHRDIKPSNIILHNGVIKVIDFGIAKDAATALTATGIKLGSPAYMSPEQWKSSKIDQRSDIWGVGILFYELLTGQLPFAGANYVEIQQKILHEPPAPPSRIRSEISPLCDRLISCMLAKKPDDRPHDIRVLIEAFKKIC
ncbi:serine/threonine protein kinase [Oleiphilus messinensis]|uniref:non-specific serine/threonine protein kinase n=1 Tax=Oleiphilus messinensis TaxID=141451 RepID=A0A1Y0IBD9_9GAMM|nr:serine/threonine-protein kinase [Oleiphilus messinensis]ARU57827.1 serine/threonine protein kinase [Oleiphilus messinensis]